ncbi:MAG: protein kinase [Gemmatimonadaceae bacterium]|nr:protein kinase [Gemmatimonadaceae bacterium]
MPTKCPACGTEYGDEARFCTKDGTRLAAGNTARATAMRNPDAPVSAAAPPSKTVTSHANMTGQVLDRRYAIVKKVGEGGMSYVYLARDVSSNERYAIKILSPTLSKDENAMARLRREAALGIRLAHPNVCHIMRMGETEDGLVYIVMPFVEGEILSDRNYRVGKTTLEDTATFITQIADGLHVAHKLGIVHRDLKPENIMICKKADGVEFAVVMDFGLAKEKKAGGELQKLTATGIILGTPEFMSPEQLRGKPLDPRTDIYSLSLMTYEMLTAKLPFEGSNQQAMMIARLRAEPIPARNRRPEIPEAVDAVLLKGMAREANERYATAPEFAAALRAAIG